MAIQFYYILIFVLLNVIITFFIFKLEGKKQDFIKYYLVIIIWFLYVHYISKGDFLLNPTLPPRFPIFIFGPYILFYLWFFLSKKNTPYIEKLPSSWPIYFQSFRIIMELIIFQTFLLGILPKEATFQGHNFEIVFAITAPVLAYLVQRKIITSKWIILIWNVTGILLLAIVVSTIAISFYDPSIWGYSEKIVLDSFIKIPLILLPAFMVPSAIFFHIFSIKQVFVK